MREGACLPRMWIQSPCLISISSQVKTTTLKMHTCCYASLATEHYEDRAGMAQRNSQDKIACDWNFPHLINECNKIFIGYKPQLGIQARKHCLHSDRNRKWSCQLYTCLAQGVCGADCGWRLWACSCVNNALSQRSLSVGFQWVFLNGASWKPFIDYWPEKEDARRCQCNVILLLLLKLHNLMKTLSHNPTLSSCWTIV